MVTQTAPASPAREASPQKDARCVHHWMVRPPDGENSWGQCRKCGRRKRFSNRFDGRDRANNSDIFANGSIGWKPDHRAGYADIHVSGAAF